MDLGVFQMESRGVLRVANVLWVPRVCSRPQGLNYAVLFQDGQVLLHVELVGLPRS
jgi:hypothetical protein